MGNVVEGTSVVALTLTVVFAGLFVVCIVVVEGVAVEILVVAVVVGGEDVA